MRAVAVISAFVALACQTSASRGASCTRSSDCASSLVCAIGRCRAQCRASRDCSIGERCLIEPATGIGVCSVEQVDDCASATCGPGFVCTNGTCVNACDAIPRCPDGVCVAGACVPVRGDAGSVPNDGSPDAPTDAGNCHGPGCDPIVHIAVGTSRTYAVTTGGELWAWGSSANYALGDGLLAHGSCATCAATPVRVLDVTGHPLEGVANVAANESGACAMLRDTTVRCWGADDAGQQGNPSGSATGLVTVVDASGTPITGVTAIAGGRNHTCVVRGAAREVWCWGKGDDGQLGRGDAMDSDVAARASVFTAPAAALVVSQAHTIVLADDHTAQGVGLDQCAVLGAGLAGTSFTMPTAMPVASIHSIATTLWDTCAIDTAGAVSCWGYAQATLGTGASMMTSTCASCVGTSDCTPMPIAFPLPTGVAFDRLVGGGEGVIFGYTSGGDAYVWGSSYGSPIGSFYAPLRIALPNHTAILEAGVSDQLCVLDALGDVYCAGTNDQGQLGRGSVDSAMSGDARLLSVVWP